MSSPEYSPSPRPTYDRPTHISSTDVRRHVWGDNGSGLVADWIYASTERIHVLKFGVAPGGGFRHSESFRTVFAADEVLYVLTGRMAAANPETGELVIAEAGESVFFRRDTWHHVFARGPEPLRVVEFFSPPPATGASGAYARTRPMLHSPLYRRDDLLGTIPGAAPTPTLALVRPTDLSWRVDGDLFVGVIASTENLTVAVVEVDAGTHGTPISHGGDALLLIVEGTAMIRCRFEDQTDVFEARLGDAIFLPLGSQYEVLSFGDPCRALLGVAPTYLP